VITLYRSHVTSILFFIIILEHLLCKVPLTCSTIIHGDFNIDFGKEVDKFKKFTNISFMYVQIYVSIPITKSNSLIDHIWSNIQSQETIFGIFDAYWADYHKSIYCAFKLLNIMPHYFYNNPKIFFN